MEPTITIRAAICSKIAKFIQTHTIGEMCKRVGLAFIAGLISAAILDLQPVIRMVQGIIHWRDNAIPLIAMVTFFTFKMPWLYQKVSDAFTTLTESDDEEVGDTIEGIPREELIDHLFTHKSFKRGDIETTFGIPRYRYTALCKKLKEIGVLTAGENNASILADVTRAQVVALLAGKSSAEELSSFQVIRQSLPSPSLREA